MDILLIVLRRTRALLSASVARHATALVLAAVGLVGSAAPASASPNYGLSVIGVWGGRVTSSPGGISCPSTCADIFDDGTEVTLVASADDGHLFDGWEGGGCSGTGTCTVTMDRDLSIYARFSPEPLQGIYLTASDTRIARGDPVRLVAKVQRCDTRHPVTLRGGGKSKMRRANAACRAKFRVRPRTTTVFRIRAPAGDGFSGIFPDRLKIRVRPS